MDFLKLALLALTLATVALEANAKQVSKGAQQSYQLFSKQRAGAGSGNYNGDLVISSDLINKFIALQMQNNPNIKKTNIQPFAPTTSSPPSSTPSSPPSSFVQEIPNANHFVSADTTTPSSTTPSSPTSSTTSSSEPEKIGADGDSAIGGGALLPGNSVGSRYYNVNEEDDDDNFILYRHKNNVELNDKTNKVYYKYGRVTSARHSNWRRVQGQRQRRRQRQRRQGQRQQMKRKQQRQRRRYDNQSPSGVRKNVKSNRNARRRVSGSRRIVRKQA